MKNINKGIFITFEGGEGCGKSTHVKLLSKYLTKAGNYIVVTHEPGGTAIGKIIRNMILKGKDKLDAYSEILLFAADRVEHIKHVVKPALDSGKLVISDRYTDSTVAYQIGGRKLPIKTVDYLNDVSSFRIVPDLTVLLDISPEKGLARVTRRGMRDKFESENMKFHHRVRAKYLQIARLDPDRVKVVSSDGSIEIVQAKIRKIIDKVLIGQ